MILSSIWERYLLKNLLKVFFLILFSFFLLYAIVDFSVHSQDFIEKGHLSFVKLSSFYLYQFTKRVSLLLPLALLISTIHTLAKLNTGRELLAFQVGGIKLQRLLRPFFFVATMCCAFSYLNEEAILPRLVAHMDQMKLLEGKSLLKSSSKKHFAVLHLDDSSKLVYQVYDPKEEAFFDVYWIRSFYDIWRMRYLSTDPKKPIARFADHLVRSKEGVLEKVDSFDSINLPYLQWQETQLFKKQSSIKYQKLSNLLLLSLQTDHKSFHMQGEIKTHFFYKLLMPLLPLLSLLFVTPSLTRYSRSLPIFAIYGVSIFLFVLFFALVSALVIIGENQILSPHIAIFSPFLLFFAVSYPRFRNSL